MCGPVAVQGYAAALQAGQAVQPDSMAAFSYSSGAADHEEGGAVAAALPQLPFQVPLHSPADRRL